MTYEALMDEYWEKVDETFNIASVTNFVGIHGRSGSIPANVWRSSHLKEMIKDWKMGYAIVSRERYEKHKILRETELYKAVYGGR